jgi:cytochrome oxidase Cu insertion factor (SCO1/SenC/PrrC family)
MGWPSSTCTEGDTEGESVKRLVPIALSIGLFASVGAAAFVAVPHQGPTRSHELENFHLVGPIGRSYSIESFPSGSVLAIYFGYTTCLGTCPTALNSIAEAIDRLGAAGASVQPVFIDMDPERAVLTNIQLYMDSFGPSFLGLTGSSDDIERAARSFKVRVERIQFSADPTDHAMKHTSPIFVMRPNDPHPNLLPATSLPADIEAALRNAL